MQGFRGFSDFMIFRVANTPRLPITSRPPARDRQGSIAQLVEQRIENPRVAGSIPARATI